MAAGKYSFIIEQGATFQRELQYKDFTGNPVDLTDYGAKMQIRPVPGSNTLYATLSSSLDSDGTGLNLQGLNGNMPYSSGSIGVYISAASSSQFNFEEASYDLELYSGSYVSRILEGKIKLSLEVTTNA
jgi:hypothetical protein